MKRLVTFWIPIGVILFFLSIIVYKGLDIIFDTKKVSANLIDSYQTLVEVENVPQDKIPGDTVYVLHLKFDNYPYVYVADSSYYHYKAVLLK